MLGTGGCGNGLVGGGLRAIVTFRVLLALSPTISSEHALLSFPGLTFPSACTTRPDMTAARVGLLIAAMGLCDRVTELRRLRSTLGDAGADADADGGPEPCVPLAMENEENVLSAASLGRRVAAVDEDVIAGAKRTAEPVDARAGPHSKAGVCGAVVMGVGVVDRLSPPVGAFGVSSIERKRPVANKRE